MDYTIYFDRSRRSFSLNSFSIFCPPSTLRTERSANIFNINGTDQIDLYTSPNIFHQVAATKIRMANKIGVATAPTFVRSAAAKCR